MELHQCFKNAGEFLTEVKFSGTDKTGARQVDVYCKLCGKSVDNKILLLGVFDCINSPEDIEKLGKKINEIDDAQEKLQLIIDKHQDVSKNQLFNLLEEDIEVLKSIHCER